MFHVRIIRNTRIRCANRILIVWLLKKLMK